MSLTWTHQHFDELNTTTLFEILKARQAVFVVEQTCPYPDIDDTDKASQHLTAWDEEQCIAAYARVVAPGVNYSYMSIGRVVVKPAYRGTGLGVELMQRAIELAEHTHGKQAIKIGAQRHLEKFYAGLGFNTSSAPYMEDGIEHVEMLRPPSP